MRVGPKVTLLRRRKGPESPWEWRGVCELCGPLGDRWLTAEQAATEAAFDHAVEHVEPRQLELEVELPNGRIRKRRNV